MLSPHVNQTNNRFPNHAWTALFFNSQSIQMDDIWTAVEKGNQKRVEELLNAGADVNAQNPTNEGTLLHYAAASGNKEFVELLLGKSAKIDIQDNHGDTALIVAAIYGRLNIVKLLLEKGAKIDIQNNNGDTAFAVVQKTLNVTLSEEQKTIFKSILHLLKRQEFNTVARTFRARYNEKGKKTGNNSEEAEALRKGLSEYLVFLRNLNGGAKQKRTRKSRKRK